MNLRKLLFVIRAARTPEERVRDYYLRGLVKPQMDGYYGVLDDYFLLFAKNARYMETDLQSYKLKNRECQ